MNYLRVYTDGTANGTQVILPSGRHFQQHCRRIEIKLVANEAETLTIEFYPNEDVVMKRDPKLGPLLYLANGERLDGLTNLQIVTENSQEGATTMFTAIVYPYGSRCARKEDAQGR